MDIRRLLRHIAQTRWGMRRRFPPSTLAAIESTVHEGERRHDGELRFAVEAELALDALWRNETARERALEVFAHLGVWDTERNNGVLVYLLLADHSVEVVADRGFNGLVQPEEWRAICHTIEVECSAGRYERGVCEGVAAVHALIARHFPLTGEGRDELSNRPVVL